MRIQLTQSNENILLKLKVERGRKKVVILGQELMAVVG